MAIEKGLYAAPEGIDVGEEEGAALLNLIVEFFNIVN